MGRITAENLAFPAASLFALFATGLVIGSSANIFRRLFIFMGCLVYYLLRPWMRQVIQRPDKGQTVAMQGSLKGARLMPSF